MAQNRLRPIKPGRLARAFHGGHGYAVGPAGAGVVTAILTAPPAVSGFPVEMVSLGCCYSDPAEDYMGTVVLVANENTGVRRLEFFAKGAVASVTYNPVTHGLYQPCKPDTDANSLSGPAGLITTIP